MHRSINMCINLLTNNWRVRSVARFMEIRATKSETLLLRVQTRIFSELRKLELTTPNLKNPERGSKQRTGSPVPPKATSSSLFPDLTVPLPDFPPVAFSTPDKIPRPRTQLSSTSVQPQSHYPQLLHPSPSVSYLSVINFLPLIHYPYLSFFPISSYPIFCLDLLSHSLLVSSYLLPVQDPLARCVLRGPRRG